MFRPHRNTIIIIFSSLILSWVPSDFILFRSLQSNKHNGKSIVSSKSAAKRKKLKSKSSFDLDSILFALVLWILLVKCNHNQQWNELDQNAENCQITFFVCLFILFSFLFFSHFHCHRDYVKAAKSKLMLDSLCLNTEIPFTSSLSHSLNCKCKNRIELCRLNENTQFEYVFHLSLSLSLTFHWIFVALVCLARITGTHKTSVRFEICCAVDVYEFSVCCRKSQSVSIEVDWPRFSSFSQRRNWNGMFTNALFIHSFIQLFFVVVWLFCCCYWPHSLVHCLWFWTYNNGCQHAFNSDLHWKCITDHTMWLIHH